MSVISQLMELENKSNVTPEIITDIEAFINASIATCDTERLCGGVLNGISVDAKLGSAKESYANIFINLKGSLQGFSFTLNFIGNKLNLQITLSNAKYNINKINAFSEKHKQRFDIAKKDDFITFKNIKLDLVFGGAEYQKLNNYFADDARIREILAFIYIIKKYTEYEFIDITSEGM